MNERGGRFYSYTPLSFFINLKINNKINEN